MVSVEICASTIRDVAVAMEAGAHRVELCSVWSVGGITPNVVVVEAESPIIRRGDAPPPCSRATAHEKVTPSSSSADAGSTPPLPPLPSV